MSEKKHDGGSAFPHAAWPEIKGMSKREFYAFGAMIGMIQAGTFIIDEEKDIQLSTGEIMKQITNPRTQGSETAFKIADAMLRAGEEVKP